MKGVFVGKKHSITNFFILFVPLKDLSATRKLIYCVKGQVYLDFSSNFAKCAKLYTFKICMHSTHLKAKNKID
jgi:hypothetical protein